MSAQTCTTHHRGCDCREAEIEHLLRRIMRWHADPSTPDYKGCDVSPCAWCLDAMRVLADPPARSEKWYTIVEKLPEHNQPVRVINDLGEMKLTFTLDNGQPHWRDRQSPYVCYRHYGVRFWQPDEEAKP